MTTPRALVPLAWSDGAVAVRVHVHPLPWPPVAVVEEGSPACRLRSLSSRWHRWVFPMPLFLHCPSPRRCTQQPG